MNNKILIYFKTAFLILAQNKARTVLTILGIVIGIASVIGVLSTGHSIKQFIIDQVSIFGTDFIEIEVKVPSKGKTSSENASGLAMGINVTTLKLDDYDAVLKHPNIKDGYAGTITQELATYRDNNRKIVIFGTSAGFDQADSGELAAGRFFDEDEDKGLAQVVVLGSALKDKLFENEDPIGKSIRIKGKNYNVIGVMEKRGGGSFFDMDEMAFIPIRTIQKKIMGVDYLLMMFFRMKDTSISQLTALELTDIMREQHDITDPVKDDFSVNTMDEMVEILDTITGAISLLLFAIGIISLIVGGVGIMNIMYVSVSERVFEIGLRKAIGAKPKDILNQFLLEAVIVTFIGGVIGIILGFLITYGISVVAAQFNFDWPFAFKIQDVFTSTIISVLVGVVAGYYPAKKASTLDPVVALRGN